MFQEGFAGVFARSAEPIAATRCRTGNLGCQSSNVVAPLRMSVDYIYWTFSSAAQSISAFVAFLLTGYALVHSLMESARERDDTLEEVHAELRKSYHERLTFLA